MIPIRTALVACCSGRQIEIDREIRVSLPSSVCRPFFFGLHAGGMQVDERVGAKQIAIRVPDSLGKRLQDIARRENNHVSSVTRRLLSSALDREEAATAPSPTRAA